MHSKTFHSCTSQHYPTNVSVEDKSMQFAYGIEMMFRQILPNLAHGNDGLIFTSLEGEYICGTDQHMYLP